MKKRQARWPLPARSGGRRSIGAEDAVSIMARGAEQSGCFFVGDESGEYVECAFCGERSESYEAHVLHACKPEAAL